MAEKKLSPRQRMINMMYLVLTALLALNVSKEVLQSFFDVNKGIERTTTNFNAKNAETYSAFNNAADNNPEKYKDVRDKAFSAKEKADKIIAYIQHMKYDLVYKSDAGLVYLGTALDILDDKGKPIKDKAFEKVSYDKLTDSQKNMPIAWLNNKSDRNSAGDLFFPKAVAPGSNKRATVLKNMIKEYNQLLVELADSNESLIAEVNMICDVSNKGSGKKLQSWEQYNFVDMPSVGALTILSKIQSDLRGMEADVINYLKRNIDAKALKFTSAEGIAIPHKNFVFRGDSFRAEIFITAKNENQNPEIYVGEYDSISPGKYEMKGEYETVKVVNGKGLFSTRASTEGMKKWGGLISMKTETGTKFYPFAGEYLVSSKTAVVSPTYMNILYEKVDNPVKISVPGYSASQITATISNGTIKPVKKSLGEYVAYPTKAGKSAIVTLYANVEGKRTKMGTVDFRVKKVPPPKPEIKFTIFDNGENIIDKTKMQTAGGVSAKMKDFDFKGINYVIVSYKMTGNYKGQQQSDVAKGPGFTDKMTAIIRNTKIGNEITITSIKAKRIDAKGTDVVNLDPIVLKIK